MMIPDDRDELHALAGEFVLGVLEANEASEVAAALATNAELRRAVAFWEVQLHPLSELTSPAEPPPGTWQAIEARITKPRQSQSRRPSGTTSRCGAGRPLGLPPPRASRCGSP